VDHSEILNWEFE
jgi:hypothetical protein